MIRAWSLLAALAFGCAGNSTSPAAAPFSTASLTDALRSSGRSVRDAGLVEQPFFTGRAHVFVVDDADLQIYEFPSAEAAERAAAEVAAGGGAIGTHQMSWMAPPHFFRKDRIIAIYLGSSQDALAELQRLLGAQFAGSA